MDPSEILGFALSQYYAGDDSSTIVVHSPDFDPDIQPVSYYFREYENMPKLEQEALKLAYGEVLDIGAAAGSHCLVLQKRGLNVTGLDLSSFACKVMTKRGVRTILNRDIFDPAEKKYDTLLMLMNGIGLVHTIDGLRQFLKHIKNFMNPGGQLLFDSTDLVYLFRDNGTNEAFIDLNKRYFGEIEYVMEYNGLKSENFFWLYIDFDTFCNYAILEGFKPEIILQDNNFQYLARLRNL